MPASAIPRVQLEDSALQRALDAHASALDALGRVPLIDGVLVSGVSLTAGVAKDVKHRLGRVPLGALVTMRKGGSADPERYPSSTPARSHTFKAASDCTIDVWIF